MSLTVRDAWLDGEPVSLRADGGTIVALGPEVTAEAGDVVVDGRGLTVTPGLVNGHTHAAMTLFRGHGDDLPLMEWLRTAIWPAEAALTADDVYWGTRLAALEMLRSGTTCFWDMYWFQFDVARAVEDAGLRAVVSVPVIEYGGRARLEPHRRGPRRARPPRRVRTPRHALARRPRHLHREHRLPPDARAELAAARDVPFQIHLSETHDEVDDCLAAHGVRPRRTSTDSDC